MFTTNLRKVGGSVMLAVPPAILDLLHLAAGAPVDMEVANGKIIIEAQPKLRYSLDELLAKCDASAPISVEDKEWLDAPASGREVI